MKTLHITFTDEEYHDLTVVKEDIGKTWHDLVLEAILTWSAESD